MNHLLCSLGTSHAIVIEAVLLLGKEIGQEAALTVSIITSASPKIIESIKNLQPFVEDHPKIIFNFYRVKDFSDLTTEAEQNLFDETLNRLYLQLRSALPDGGKLFVCLAGGFKTMSASMQQSVGWFGADGLFHLLAQSNPTTEEDVRKAMSNQTLTKIDLYAPSGWPQLRALTANDYPLRREPDQSFPDCLRVFIASAPPHESEKEKLTKKIHDIVNRAARIAGNLDKIANLPFPGLAAWNEEHLACLDEPLHSENDRAWIEDLPKIDLHLHLGGFATHGDELRQVQAARREVEKLLPAAPDFPPGWPEPDECCGLEQYRQLGDASGSKLLNDVGCLKKQCELLYDHLRQQHVIYAEIRCSPAKYVNPSQDEIATPWQVLECVRDTFRARMEKEKSPPGLFYSGPHFPDTSLSCAQA
jgi:hypothetical protein